MQPSSSRRKPLTQQLLFTITSLVVTALLLATALFTFQHNKHLNRDLQSDISQLKTQLESKGLILTRQVSEGIDINLIQLNLTALQQELSTLVTQNDDLDFAILMSRERTAYAHSKRPEYQSRTLDDNHSRLTASFDEPASLEYNTPHGNYLETVFPIKLRNQNWGVLRLGFTLTPIESMASKKRADIKSALYWSLITGALIAITFLIIASLIALRISERLTNPLREITLKSEDIIAGNYQSFLDTAKRISDDKTEEIASVGLALQQLSQNLEQSQQAVKEYTQHLEQKVDSRTNELESARQQVDMANTLKGEFLANMSHEIRTPLSAVMGLTHLLGQTSLTPRQQDYTRKLANSGENLLGIINDILDFAKIEAGMLQLEKVSFSFDGLLNDMIKSVGGPAQEKGLELIVDVKNSLPNILIGDAARFKQVLLNLLNNAVKFTECGEIIVTIEVQESNGQRIQLLCSVSDTGIGMSPEQSSNLFKSFRHTDSSISRLNGGAGLGLSISKKLVEMMNGAMSVSSTYGIGSEFTFTANFGLPLRHQYPEPLSVTLLPILLVDNNSHASDAMARTLKRLGCAVTQVNSSENALSDLNHASKTGQPYRLIIIKADLPQLRGEELAQRIRADFKEETPPKILLLTRFSDARAYDALIGHGLDATHTAPVSENNLKQVIKCLLIAFDPIVSAPPTEEHPTLQGRHLLLAEDDEINQQVATELLRSQGVEVTIANNGRETLDLLLGKNPISIDGILMDLQMPKVDGYKTTSRLRSDPRYKTLPIIGLTALSSEEEKQRCLKAGMQAHLPKPIALEDLLRAIKEFILPQSPNNTPGSTQLNQLAELPKANNFPGIDLKKGLQRVGNNYAIYSRIIKQFIAKNADTADNIRQQLLIKQFDSVQALAHSLRGASASIGASELAYSASNLEQAIKTKQSDAAIARHLDEFEKIQQATLNSLSEALDYLENKALVADAKPPTMRPVLNSSEHIGILLVDDNPTNLDVLKQQLSIIGYEAETCQDGVAGWQKWQEGDYHLILTDINMPGMDGYELTRRIRDYEAGSSHVPIIAFTATTSQSDASRCLNIGMDEFLIKPMALQELQQTLEKWLPKHPLPQVSEHPKLEGSTQQLSNTANDGPIDIVILIQIIGDDIKVHRRLFESFIKTASMAISAINTGVESSAAEVVIKQAHKIKSASRNLGAMKLGDLCEAIEGAARAGQYHKVISLLPTLNRLFDEVQEFVNNYIDTTLSA